MGQKLEKCVVNERTHPGKIKIPLGRHKPIYKNSICALVGNVSAQQAEPFGSKRDPLATSHTGLGILWGSTEESCVVWRQHPHTGGRGHADKTEPC